MNANHAKRLKINNNKIVEHAKRLRSLIGMQTDKQTKRITKHYNYLRQAESYQNRLYNRFDYVRLVAWPMFTNYGNYTWEVR